MVRFTYCTAGVYYWQCYKDSKAYVSLFGLQTFILATGQFIFENFFYIWTVATWSGSWWRPSKFEFLAKVSLQVDCSAIGGFRSLEVDGPAIGEGVL